MRIAVFLTLVAMLVAPSWLAAQEAELPPLPRPRPNPELRAPIPAPPPAGAETAGTTATEAIQAVTSTPQPVHLSARVTEDGAAIAEGLVWRIFDTKTDASGQLAMVAKSDEADVDLTLPPGEYVVHVAYGRAQASDTLLVNPGSNDKSVILEAGGLRLNAAVTGDIEIPINLLRFEVYTGESNAADRKLVAENLLPNNIVTLNAGTYHVVSYFGALNAVVRADLRVEPGQMTEATLYHRASQIGFKLVSEPGGEAIADVEWTVNDADGKTLLSEIGAFPATVLAEGEYVVLAKRGDTVFNRQFAVNPGQPQEIEVLTAVY